MWCTLGFWVFLKASMAAHFYFSWAEWAFHFCIKESSSNLFPFWKIKIWRISWFFSAVSWFCSYLFWFMEDIGSPKWLLGMTNTVSVLSALPVIAASTFIVRRFGHTNLIIVCVMLYGCRFFLYSLIYNPFLILPVETLEAFTTSLLWVVISVYCGKIAPGKF